MAAWATGSFGFLSGLICQNWRGAASSSLALTVTILLAQGTLVPDVVDPGRATCVSQAQPMPGPPHRYHHSDRNFG